MACNAGTVAATCKGHRSNVGMGDHGFTHFWTETMKNIEHSVWETCLLDPCAQEKAVTGVSSEGLATTQFPAANAGATFHVNR